VLVFSIPIADAVVLIVLVEPLSFSSATATPQAALVADLHTLLPQAVLVDRDHVRRRWTPGPPGTRTIPV
jgi:hypothetical protein